MSERHYYLGPWVWDQTDPDMPHWRAPSGTVGLVDLRDLSMPTTYGFFSTAARLADESDHIYLGADLYGGAPAGVRGDWNGALGVNVEGNSILDLLWNTLTLAADPDGGALCPPLMPTHKGELELHLGGHSLVRSARFRGEKDPAWPLVQAMVQRNIRAIRNGRGKGGPPDHIADQAKAALAGKYVECMRRKLRVADDRKLIPADVRDVRARKPETTITESFNKADSDILGPDLTWTELGGDTDVASNEAVFRVGASCLVRAEHDLSSDDHYAALKLITFTGTTSNNQHGNGTIVRFDPSAQNYYHGRAAKTGSELWQLYKVVSGGFTQLDALTEALPAAPFIIKNEADGSTIRLLYDAAEKLSVTDTTHTGYLRTGMRSYSGAGATDDTADNFEAADLVAAALAFPFHQIYRRLLAA